MVVKWHWEPSVLHFTAEFLVSVGSLFSLSVTKYRASLFCPSGINLFLQSSPVASPGHLKIQDSSGYIFVSFFQKRNIFFFMFWPCFPVYALVSWSLSLYCHHLKSFSPVRCQTPFCVAPPKAFACVGLRNKTTSYFTSKMCYLGMAENNNLGQESCSES